MPQSPSIACTLAQVQRVAACPLAQSPQPIQNRRVVLAPLEAVVALQRIAVLYGVQLAFACEVEDFNTAVGQLAYMPSNQFLGVQSLGVGKGSQRQRLRL